MISDQEGTSRFLQESWQCLQSKARSNHLSELFKCIKFAGEGSAVTSARVIILARTFSSLSELFKSK